MQVGDDVHGSIVTKSAAWGKIALASASHVSYAETTILDIQEAENDTCIEWQPKAFRQYGIHASGSSRWCGIHGNGNSHDTPVSASV
jgi:hypothetical protein